MSVKNMRHCRSVRKNENDKKTLSAIGLSSSLGNSKRAATVLFFFPVGQPNAGLAPAVLAASIFHFGTYTIGEAKEHMAAQLQEEGPQEEGPQEEWQQNQAQQDHHDSLYSACANRGGGRAQRET